MGPAIVIVIQIKSNKPHFFLLSTFPCIKYGETLPRLKKMILFSVVIGCEHVWLTSYFNEVYSFLGDVKFWAFVSKDFEGVSRGDLRDL